MICLRLGNIDLIEHNRDKKFFLCGNNFIGSFVWRVLSRRVIPNRLIINTAPTYSHETTRKFRNIRSNTQGNGPDSSSSGTSETSRKVIKSEWQIFFWCTLLDSEAYVKLI